MNSRLFLSFLMILVSISLFSLSSYATCISYSSVEVSQGGFLTTYNPPFSIFYVKGNTLSDPVTLSFIFENPTQCTQNYTLQKDLSSLDQPTSVSFDSQQNKTVVSFLIDSLQIENFNIMRLFHSENVFMGQVELRKDETIPSVSLHLLNSQGGRISPLVAAGTNITLRIDVNDVVQGYGSDINSISIGNLKYFNGDDFNTSISGTRRPGILNLEREIFVSTNFLVNVEDNVGNIVQESLFVEVDSSAPLVNGFGDRGVFSENGGRKYSFFVEVSDSSFDSFTSPQNVTAKFSPSSILNPSIVTTQDCRFIIGSKYVCHFSEIDVTALQTTSLNITVTAQDAIGNVGEGVFTGKEIFIDSQPPLIEEFYFENSFGGINIVSPEANGSIILYLKYFDETGLDSAMGVRKYFDELLHPISDPVGCGELCIFWNFTTGSVDSNFAPYLLKDNQRAIFKVILKDAYQHSSEANQTLLFDRFVPKIINSTHVEGDETCQGSTIVKDSLIQSCEEFDVEVIIHELEERYGENLRIYGNFSRISTRDSLAIPQCEIENLGSDLLEYRCVFENLEAAQGHLFSNYSIIVEDSAGNRAENFFDFEILNTSYDLTQERYDINDLDVLAPLSRILLDQDDGQGEVVGWFEGELRDKMNNDGFEIVNYQLLNCLDFQIDTNSDFGTDTLRVINPSLYPTRVETIFTAENPLVGVDKDFIMSFVLDKFENPSLLSEVQTTCIMAVLYRDATTIYEPPQLINFTVNVDFYDLPRGHLLRAHAESLRDDLEDIENLEKYFGGAYETYETFAEICNAVNNVCTVVSTASNVMTAVSNGLFTTGFGAGFADLISTTDNYGTGYLQFICDEETSYIKQACNWVTCENTLLPGMKEFFEELQFDMSFATCSALNNPAEFFGGNN